MNSTTSSNKYLKIPDFSMGLHTFVNDAFKIEWIPRIFSSTQLRMKNDLSLDNRLEIQKIKEYKYLEENWDSYGAAKISEEAIQKAIEFIWTLNRFDEDVYLSSPGPNGEVMLQIKNKNKEIEFIFYTDKHKFVRFNKGEFLDQGDYFKEKMLEFIQWLYEI